MIDPFFEQILDGEWNACIGVQGSETNYVDGYLEAARILADTVIEKELVGSLDTLAMPILYNARHGLELALKYVFDRLVSIAAVPVRDGAADHDILSYWGHLDAANVADRRIRHLVAEIEPYVRSLARVDAQGQELRYFKRQDGARSLNDLAVVNIPHIRANLERLAALLGDMTHRADALCDEHATGTRTTRCSRADLVQIADIVGDHSTWSDDSFLDRKHDVMERFGLTNKAFSNAVDKICATRPLAARVEIETALLHLQDEHAIQLARDWLKVFPHRADDVAPRMVDAATLGFDEIQPYLNAVRVLVETTERNLSLEEFADVETIFQIGRNYEPGESYEDSLEETIREHGRKARSQVIRHIVSKKNLLDALITGLAKVGRPSLSRRLADVRDEARGCSGDKPATS